MKKCAFGFGVAAALLAGCAADGGPDREEGGGEAQGVNVTSVTLNADGTQTVRSTVWTQEQALRAIAEREARPSGAAAAEAAEGRLGESGQAISIDAGCGPTSLWISDSTAFSGPGVSLLCYVGVGSAPMPADWNGSAAATHRPKAIWSGDHSGFLSYANYLCDAGCVYSFKGRIETGSFQQTNPLWADPFAQQNTFYGGVTLVAERNPVHRAVGGAHHFYTLSAAEVFAAGYTMEVQNYFDLSGYALAGTTPFYRCNLGANGHLYTASSNCENNPSAFEGQMGYIATSQIAGTTPLYRVAFPGSGDHFYTLSSNEVLSATIGGGVYEGVAGYVWNHI